MGAFQVYFGGTFDPPHLGHHDMLAALIADSWVEKIHVVPTGKNPLKPARDVGVVTDAQRLEWLNLWLGEFSSPKVVLETLEIDRGGVAPQYTVDTLLELQRCHPGQRWVLCVGGDIPREFHRWKNVETLFKVLAAVWVFPRGDQADPLADLQPALRSLVPFRIMTAPVTDISSTLIRESLQGPNALQNIAAAPLLPVIKQNLTDLVRSTK
ncbi:MAG: nicotinate-nicotinamide nucleotide adenylyltransferase [Bdellovibrionales bacterium]|nr:nicotinate-nicotinamide nucleotide adenylyltransferase [Bdellovibrionales bacterium]